jgi:ketol-acid reductoisomerase
MKLSYSPEDMNLDHLKDQKVAVIGYGIQGRHQSQNLRDSGIEVLVHNRGDQYANKAREDGFIVYPIDQAVKESDIIMMLIPDGSQAKVYHEDVDPQIKDGSMLVTAHGYSITYGGLKPKPEIDVTLLAPRFPGQVIRENYLNGRGTLAFFDAYRDVTGTGKKRGLGLARAVGLTDLLQVGLEEETHADLFIENFLIPRLRGTIEACYNVLVKAGISKEVAALEAYQSGEILGLLVDGFEEGMYEAFHNKTSPTCQYAVSEGDKSVNAGAMQVGRAILEDIKSGGFARRLSEEESANYPQRNQFNQKNLDSGLSQILKELRE